MLKPSDYSAIARAVSTCPGTSPHAREFASELVQAWVERWQDEDAREKTVAVECKFNVRLDNFTWVVGIIDRISRTAEGEFVANEWKTTKAPSGWGWNEEKWLSEIVNGIQLPTYAWAVRSGRVTNAKGKLVECPLAIGAGVKVRARAVTKVSPPGFWPTRESGVWEFSEEDMKATAHAYLNAARMIRELKTEAVFRLEKQPDVALPPWQATGRQCFNQFGRDCEFLTQCQEHLYPVGEFKLCSEGDYKEFGLPDLPNDPRVVVFSPTSYELWVLCAEKWRVVKGIGVGERESDVNLEVGKAVHAGLATFYTRFM